MSDAAAFFANKKKKKKTFKFNANKIDAATVTQTVHVDAPALSTAAIDSAAAALGATTIADAGQEAATATTTTTPAADGAAAPTGGEWDDEALAASYARKGAPNAGATAELLDMKAFDAKRRDQDDIKERMRVEETKAQLAAAKAGMEREAARLKEERDNKDFVAVKKPEPRGMGFGGSKWVPPHMRAGGGATGGVGLQRSRMGALGSAKLDTQDENLFPDLAAADKILEQKKEGVAYKVHKKTPVGGGATWGSRPVIKVRAPVVVKPKAAEPEPEPKAPEPEPTPAPAPAAAPVSAAPVMKKKPTKKKKKDLSTFKPSS